MLQAQSTPKLSPLQKELLQQLLADYACWYMTNRETLEHDSALGVSVPQDTPLEYRVQFLYGDAML